MADILKDFSSKELLAELYDRGVINGYKVEKRFSRENLEKYNESELISDYKKIVEYELIEGVCSKLMKSGNVVVRHTADISDNSVNSDATLFVVTHPSNLK
jgi:hypothetical protein